MKFNFWLFTLFLSSVLLAQKKDFLSDAEFTELQHRARLNINSNIDSSFYFAKKIELSEKTSHKTFAYGIKSYLFQLKGDTVESKKTLKKAFQLLNQLPHSKSKIQLHSYLLNYAGLIEWKKNNLGKALKYYSEGKALSNQINDIEQIVKFNNNISLIYSDVKEFDSAIKTSKETYLLLRKYGYLFDKDQFYLNKSNTSFNIANHYFNLYNRKVQRRIYLDSAEFYFKEAVSFSDDLFLNKLNSELSLAGIYQIKGLDLKAEKMYHELLQLTANHPKERYIIYYNLGYLYYKTKREEKALVCFKKVDSLYAVHPVRSSEFINSKYWQAKIFNSNGKSEQAYKCSTVYLDTLSKYEAQLNSEMLEVKSKIGFESFKKEMNRIKVENYQSFIISRGAFGLALLIFISILSWLVVNIRQKKSAEEKIKKLIDEFSQEKNDRMDMIEIPSDKFVLNIDEEKELKILHDLRKLEEKQFFLSKDFTLPNVAKKIKTNTTYLSYIVNKRFGKTFSDYSNELKINYVISEMINNSLYRKYSTQAIAESVGFKSAISFTKSFSKRTGVTPTQFAKRFND
ncbi:helix-turn-helix domain-containing protein [Flavobacterium sp. GCM10023249]|uniref:helix-turn-helix domain-containing protein n=1 Tax=unclassified Flavobacterium TaxID=196869 RepID=UPI00361218A4